MSLVDRVKSGARDFVVGVKDTAHKYISAVTDNARSGVGNLAIYTVLGAHRQILLKIGF